MGVVGVVTLSRFFLVAAALCFAIALLLSLSVFSGSNEQAWVDGGLLSTVLGLLIP